jgi:hypothetical protein
MTPYKSKVARLNVECSDPVLLQNCIPGQKWRCINEGGRWRKHKCKFHAQLQNHLAALNQFNSENSNRRNCACFTPDGLIYTKIKGPRGELQEHWRNSGNKLFGRKKRSRRDVTDINDADYDFHDEIEYSGLIDDTTFKTNSRLKREIHAAHYEVDAPESHHTPVMINLLRISRYIDSLEITLEHQQENNGHRRQKRESLSRISSIVEQLQNELETIESNFQVYPSSEETDTTTRASTSKCFVERSGRVNCSSVADDEKLWRKSRVQVDILIKVLKNKINDLKEIRKNLKENRPIHVLEDDEDVSSLEEDTVNKAVIEKSESEKTDDQIVEEERNRRKGHNRKTNTRKPTNGRRVRPNGQTSRGRSQKNEDDNEGPLIDLTWFTTEEPKLPSASTTETLPIIRHSHKHRNHTLAVPGRGRTSKPYTTQSPKYMEADSATVNPFKDVTELVTNARVSEQTTTTTTSTTERYYNEFSTSKNELIEEEVPFSTAISSQVESEFSPSTDYPANKDNFDAGECGQMKGLKNKSNNSSFVLRFSTHRRHHL